MTPDEVRMLDNRYALLFIRGERPVMDLKYDIMKHPAVGMTADGKAEPYIHGQTSGASFTMSLTVQPEDIEVANAMNDAIEIIDADYELLSEEEVEKEAAEEAMKDTKDGGNTL